MNQLGGKLINVAIAVFLVVVIAHVYIIDYTRTE